MALSVNGFKSQLLDHAQARHHEKQPPSGERCEGGVIDETVHLKIVSQWSEELDPAISPHLIASPSDLNQTEYIAEIQRETGGVEKNG